MGKTAGGILRESIERRETPRLLLCISAIRETVVRRRRSGSSVIVCRTRWEERGNWHREVVQQ